MTSLSKIEIRSVVIKELLRLKENFNPENFSRTKETLNKIEDRKFVITLIIKEISGKNRAYDDILKSLLIKNFRNECEEELQNEIFNDKNSDEKKFCIINILRGLDSDKNIPDTKETDNSENLSHHEIFFFLKDTIKSIGEQINFLDFLYTIDSKDRTLLLESIISEYSDDELANTLLMALYLTENEKSILKIIKALGKTNSYYALEALDYVLSKNYSEAVNNSAQNAKKELISLGLNEAIKEEKLYKEILKDSEFYEAYSSLFDAKGDFTLTFARKKKDGRLDAFFTALNLEQGVLASFGLENMNDDEYNKIMGKIFSKDIKIKINPSVLTKFINDAIQNGKNPAPYEVLCWKKLTHDIKPEDMDLNFIKNFNQKHTDELGYKMLLEKDYMQTWFFKEDDNKYFRELISELKKINSQGIEATDNAIKRYRTDIFKEMSYFGFLLTLQSYLLNLSGKENESRIFYQISVNSELCEDFQEKIIHKSIYEYFYGDDFSVDCKLSRNFLDIMEKWEKEF